MSTIAVALFLLGIWLTGAVYAWQVLRIANFTVRLGAPVIIGEILYISAYTISGNANPISVLLYVLAFATLMAAGTRLLVTKSLKQLQGPKAAVSGPHSSDWVCGLLVFAVYVIRTFAFGGFDDLNHSFFASQIVSGKFPPGAFAFVDLPAKYHYGWDILLASTSLVSHLQFPLANDILTLFSVAGSLSILIGVLRMLGLTVPARCLALVGLFLGGGVLEFAGLLAPKLGPFSLSLLSLYHQHAWCFVVNMFLLLTAVLVTIPRPSIKDGLIVLGWLFPLFYGSSIYAATFLPVIGLFLGVLAIECISLKRELLVKFLLLGGIGVYGALLIGCWLTQKGMLAPNPQFYDSPKLRLAFTVFGWQKYVQYEGAYLLMAPLGLWGFCFSLAYTAKNRFSILRLPISNRFLIICCLCLFPLPLFLLIENSAYWDNFCKFNVVGIIAGWLLVCILQGSRWREWKDLRLALRERPFRWLLCLVCTVGPVSFLITQCAESFALNPDGDLFWNRQLRWEARRREKADLLRYFREHVPIGHQVLILNKDVDRMYPLSRVTNKPDVNLYGYVATYFDDFRILAEAGGVSILNFYDFNFLYNRSKEYALYDALNEAFAGEADALRNLPCSELLVMKARAPAFLERWLACGAIKEQYANNQEGWVLYKKSSVN